MQGIDEQLRDIRFSALNAWTALQNADGQSEEEKKAIGAARRETELLIDHLDSAYVPFGQYGGLQER